LVRDLPEAAELYRKALGTTPCHTGELPQYGLANMVLPAGQCTFIELLQPTSANSNAARYLERRGEAPYMLIFETRKFDELVVRLKSLDVRISGQTEEAGHRSVFIHPASANGAFLEIIEVNDSNNPWPAAGPNWTAEGADGPYRAAPSVMVVVPTSEHVVLDFSNTSAENLGTALTVITLAGLGTYWYRRRKRTTELVSA